MATHSYIARLIAEKNSFPGSYEPIAPSDDFGSSYMGLSILIAAVSKTAKLSINESALITSVFVYVLLSLSVYIFLSERFPKTAGFLTMFSVIWIGKDVTQYFLWGGNPTILALAFLFFTVSYLTAVIKSGKFSGKSALILAFFVSGSFLSHPTPVVVVLYVALGLLLLNFKFIKKTLGKHKIFILLVAFFTLIFIAPFLSSFKVPSAEIFEQIKNIQRSDTDNTNWTGNIFNSLYTIPLYIRDRAGYSLFFLVAAGIFLSLFKRSREKFMYLESVVLTAILIINCRYWFLPLSPLLFPDRIVTTVLIAFSYFIAVFFETFLSYAHKFSKIQGKKPSETLTFLLALNFLVVFFINDYWQTGKWVYEKSSDFTSVNQGDLDVFNWIYKNTSENEVILNNYGDSGIWIPALAYRKITNYDATLYDLKKFQTAIKNYSPDYLFIGTKPVYTDSIQYSYDSVKNRPNYEEVFSSGGAHLFRITKT